jgi:NAD-dependent SIR2 family protein deacetylase
LPRERVQRCFDALDASRSVLVLGSSLAVMSGYRFVRRAAARGIPVAIVTHGVTRGDAQATLRLDEPLAPTLGRLVAALS